MALPKPSAVVFVDPKEKLAAEGCVGACAGVPPNEKPEVLLFAAGAGVPPNGNVEAGGFNLLPSTACVDPNEKAVGAIGLNLLLSAAGVFEDACPNEKAGGAVGLDFSSPTAGADPNEKAGAGVFDLLSSTAGTDPNEKAGAGGFDLLSSTAAGRGTCPNAGVGVFCLALLSTAEEEAGACPNEKLGAGCPPESGAGVCAVFPNEKAGAKEAESGFVAFGFVVAGVPPNVKEGTDV